MCNACVAAPTTQTRTLCRRCGKAVVASVGLEDLRFSGMLPEGLLCKPCRMVPPEWTLTAAHEVLRRVRSTEDQYGLSTKGRPRNLRGAFEVAEKDAVRGRECCWWMTF